MADLDDFFAKKDKKKSKSKKQKGENVDLSSEKEKKKVQKKNKPGDFASEVGRGEERQANEVEEWKDYEEEKEADLTGLKINKLTIDSDEEKDDDEDGTGEGPDGKKGGNPPGPWKVVPGTTAPEEQQETTGERTEEDLPSRVTPASASDDDREAKRGGSTYIPPALRGRMQNSSSGSSGNPVGIQGRRRGAGKGGSAAPDIKDEQLFPTLGASLDPKVAALGAMEDTAGFESVRHGSRTLPGGSAPGPKLNLGNRFGTLQDSRTS
ncbi:unnamed protein product [Cyprideis torosa]|uniref:Uncharacterized protein n=1 Tax=Cyprideis torosa TaxID=163714 RepID=A0A7R8ZQB3_9CRUS|nr:unnamed protein product [Cyprideis torosa]CAG0895935.1 unnamed protein product [Cyprideis torosa]